MEFPQQEYFFEPKKIISIQTQIIEPYNEIPTLECMKNENWNREKKR